MYVCVVTEEITIIILLEWAHSVIFVPLAVSEVTLKCLDIGVWGLAQNKLPINACSRPHEHIFCEIFQICYVKINMHHLAISAHSSTRSPVRPSARPPVRTSARNSFVSIVLNIKRQKNLKFADKPGASFEGVWGPSPPPPRKKKKKKKERKRKKKEKKEEKRKKERGNYE